MKVGEIIAAERDIILNQGRRTKVIVVANIGDRPIQVGSHFHFFEVNSLLEFDREAAYGMRLDIPSGTSVRFEPGESKKVNLVEIGGNKRIYGFSDLTIGDIQEQKDVALKRATEKGFTAGGEGK